MDKNGETVYEPGLTVVKDLLESEDSVKYLGFYILNSYVWLMLF